MFPQIQNYQFYSSLGIDKYSNLIKNSKFIIGNSSSGVHEVPSFKIGTLNLGNRQKGRIKIKSVVNSDFKEKNIIKGIKKILSKKFKTQIKNIKNPYYKKNTSNKIIQKLLLYKNRNLLIKKFND